MEPLPRASILIVNFNYGKYLAEAIDSALAQTYPNVEVIVVDDGSTDNSREVIGRYHDRVIAIFQENRGQPEATNAAFAKSTGDIICLLDSDDTFRPDKIERVVSVMRETGAEWFFHRIERTFDEVGGCIGEGLQDIRDTVVKRGRLPILRTATSAMCFSRPLAEKLFPYPTSRFASMKTTPDMVFKAGSAALAVGYFSYERLTWMRLHDANNYSGRGASLRSDWRKRGELALYAAEELRKKLPCTRRFANRLATTHMIPFVLFSPYRGTAVEYWTQSSWGERFYLFWRSIAALGKWIPQGIRLVCGMAPKT